MVFHALVIPDQIVIKHFASMRYEGDPDLLRRDNNLQTVQGTVTGSPVKLITPDVTLHHLGILLQAAFQTCNLESALTVLLEKNHRHGENREQQKIIEK